MPHIRYPRRVPTEDWQQLRLLLKDPAQIKGCTRRLPA
jgi:hypothetical protein